MRHHLRLFAPILLAAGLSACSAAREGAPLATTPAQAAAMQSISIAAPDGRLVDLYVATPPNPRGVILFSHGGGSTPLATPHFTALLVADGFAVVAPMHTDSQELPPARRTTLRGAFPTRVADLKVAGGYVSQRFAGLPVGAVGYSYGALAALVGGGGLASMMSGTVAEVKAVATFSSPGPIAPLTETAEAFTSVKVPTLLVTGTKDVVPNFVPDPATHLLYFHRLPAGGRTALVVRDGTHWFFGGKEPGFDEATRATRDFLAANVLGNAKAKARFAAIASTDRIEVRRR